MRKVSEPTLRLLAAAAEPGATYESVATKLGRGLRYITAKLRRLGFVYAPTPKEPELKAPKEKKPPKLEPFTMETLAEAYQRLVNGEALRDIAASCGVHYSLLSRRWLDHGFPRLDKEVAQRRRSAGCARARTLLSKEDVEKVREMNAAGLNEREISRALGLKGKSGTVYSAMRRHGISPRLHFSGYVSRKKFSDSDVKAAYVRFIGGESAKDIAKSLNCSAATLYCRWNDAGFPRIKPRRQDWRGTPSKQKQNRRKHNVGT